MLEIIHYKLIHMQKIRSHSQTKQNIILNIWDFMRYMVKIKSNIYDVKRIIYKHYLNEIFSVD